MQNRTESYKREHREYMREYMRNKRLQGQGATKEYYRSYVQALRVRAMEVLGGPACCECGCDVMAVLEINHIYGGGNQERKVREYKSFLRDIIFKRVDVSKLNVLCVVCNAKHKLSLIGVNGHKIVYTAS